MKDVIEKLKEEIKEHLSKNADRIYNLFSGDEEMDENRIGNMAYRLGCDHTLAEIEKYFKSITPSHSPLTWEEALKEADKYSTAKIWGEWMNSGENKTTTPEEYQNFVGERNYKYMSDYLSTRYPLHPPMEIEQILQGLLTRMEDKDCELSRRDDSWKEKVINVRAGIAVCRHYVGELIKQYTPPSPKE